MSYYTQANPAIYQVLHTGNTAGKNNFHYIVSYITKFTIKYYNFTKNYFSNYTLQKTNDTFGTLEFRKDLDK